MEGHLKRTALLLALCMRLPEGDRERLEMEAFLAVRLAKELAAVEVARTADKPERRAS